MKSLFLVASIFSIGLALAGESIAQFCGGSTRIIRLELPSSDEWKVEAEYELFFLMPKNKDGEFVDQSAFLSEFFGDQALDYQSLRANKKGDTFIEVEKSRAEEYLKTYDADDFSEIYSDYWKKEIRKQMTGKFNDGTLKLKTTEMDDTAFFMKVSFPGYETQYLAAIFLGGCFGPDSRHPQKIVMRPAPIDPKCLARTSHGGGTEACKTIELNDLR